MFRQDDDVKIYGGGDEGEQLEFWEGEQAAKEYIFHKENGDFEKAKRMGSLLARALVDASRSFGERPYSGQKTVMLSFLVKDELAERIENQMLREAAADYFTKAVAELSESVNATITDSTAFTMYILNDRSGGGRSDGEILADLCDSEEDAALVRDGDELSAGYRTLFAEIIGSFEFEKYPQ